MLIHSIIMLLWTLGGGIGIEKKGKAGEGVADFPIFSWILA